MSRVGIGPKLKRHYSVSLRSTVVVYLLCGAFFVVAIIMVHQWSVLAAPVSSGERESLLLRLRTATVMAPLLELDIRSTGENDNASFVQELLRSQHLDVGRLDAVGDGSLSRGGPVQIDKMLGPDTVLLIICANRPEYLRQSLDAVIKHYPRHDDFPIVISQDGYSSEVDAVINHFTTRLQSSLVSGRAVIDVQHIHHDNSGYYENGYSQLAAHYKWALNQVFSGGSARVRTTGPATSARRVIILEEDLVIAPDFFELFAATKDLLDEDPSLLAVSAWNDNGRGSCVHRPDALYRSDFFPGLGWMMPLRIWYELGPMWPSAYWDDWLREPSRRKGRHTIRPEVCRTLHIGQRGVSNAQYSEFLNSIKLNADFTPFTRMDLGYVASTVAWEDYYFDAIRRADLVRLEEVRGGRHVSLHDIKIRYDRIEGGSDSFSAAAAWAGAMDNVKAGVPRTAYRGIVTVWKDNAYVHLVPKSLPII